MRGALNLMTWFLVMGWMALATSFFGLILLSAFDDQIARRLWDDYGGTLPLAVPFIGGLAITTVFLFAVMRRAAALNRAEGIAGPSVERREVPEDEAELLAEIHRGLARMDQRIEALETILLERKSEARRL